MTATDIQPGNMDPRVDDLQKRIEVLEEEVEKLKEEAAPSTPNPGMEE